MAGYFSFHRLVSTSIVKFSYVLGLVAISLSGVGCIAFAIYQTIQQFQAAAPDSAVTDRIVILMFAGIVTLTVGNLLWRLLCEGWILLFSIHELLGSIERNTLTRSQERA
jgi:uncharacterized protein (AIM24 family)